MLLIDKLGHTVALLSSYMEKAIPRVMSMYYDYTDR